MAKRLGGRVSGMVKKVGLPVAARLAERAAAALEAADRALDEQLARARARKEGLRTRAPSRPQERAPARRRPTEVAKKEGASRQRKGTAEKRDLSSSLEARAGEPLRSPETREVPKPRLRKVVRKEAQPAAKQKRAKVQVGTDFHVKRGQKHRHNR